MSEDECVPVNSKKGRWTESEKSMLLQGLKKYGSQDIKKLKYFVPHKSEKSILQMIRKYRAIAELGKKEVNSPLDVWLRSGIFDDEDFLISEALLFIYLFENHPSKEETAGFDLKEMYKFMYEASKGHSPEIQLSSRTVDMLKQLIMTIDNEIWPLNVYSSADCLINKLSTVELEKTYKRRRTD